MLEAIGTLQAEPTYIPTSISDIHTCRHTYRADMHTYRHENTQTEVLTNATYFFSLLRQGVLSGG